MSDIVKRRKDGTIRVLLTEEQARQIVAAIGAIEGRSCTYPVFDKLDDLLGGSGNIEAKINGEWVDARLIRVKEQQ